jgi:nickel transport protein
LRYIILFFLLFSISYAHKVNLFISQDDGVLDIYSYFANGAPCKNCQLIIKDKESIIVDAKFDDKGKYLFTPTTKNIEVIVDASGGHRASEMVEVQNVKKEDIKEHLQKEQSDKNLKILIGFGLIFFIFLALKVIKRK